MKKFLWFLAGALSVFTLTAFASTTSLFKDEASFDDWYKDSVSSMSNLGIIKGYPDGTFGPNNNISRAEMAVMLDRFYDLIDQKMDQEFENNLEAALFNLEKFSDSDMDYMTKVSVVLAGIGYKLMHDVDDTPYCDQDFVKIESEDIPDNFTVYMCATLGLPYYVNYVYQGGVPESGEVVDMNNWYGPFSEFNTMIMFYNAN